VLMHGLYDVWMFGVPVAIRDGHLWLGSTFADLPVVIYSVPAAMILGGALFLRALAQRALDLDDEDEALMIHRWAHPQRYHPVVRR
jgi:hypothetical protein